MARGRRAFRAQERSLPRQGPMILSRKAEDTITSLGDGGGDDQRRARRFGEREHAGALGDAEARRAHGGRAILPEGNRERKTEEGRARHENQKSVVYQYNLKQWVGHSDYVSDPSTTAELIGHPIYSILKVLYLQYILRKWTTTP